MTASETIRTLADYLAESHAEEIAANHHGDGRRGCSYCDAIRDAKPAATRAARLEEAARRVVEQVAGADVLFEPTGEADVSEVIRVNLAERALAKLVKAVNS